jgi:two-component system LytT family response regulator
MEKLRALIVDDELIAREGLRIYLEAEQDMEITGECANGLEAVSAIQEQRPDLVFLDVQMPGLDGFGVIETIGVERMPTVIFVTAYDKYALRAFDAHALDYLLKPFDNERFSRALQRARAQIRREIGAEANHQLLALIADLKAVQSGQSERLNPNPKHLERIVIKTAGRIFFMSVDEIDWVEAADNYVKLHAGHESHFLRETVSGLATKLDPQKFLRIRRSTLVNIDHIKELHPLFNGEYLIILRNGKELTSSRRYRINLKTLLGA